MESPIVAMERVPIEAGQQRAQARIEMFYRRTGRLAILLMFLAGVGLELTAALTFHEALVRVMPVWSLLEVHRRLRRIRRQMVACAMAIEHWKQEPEIVREKFVRGALFEAGRQHEGTSGGRYHLPQELALSMGILLFIFLFVLLVAFFVRDALAEETVVVGVDFSGTSAGDELLQNLHTVEEVIARLKLGSRFVVIGITEYSFSGPPIMDAQLSADPGLFDERLKAGQQQLTKIWKEKSKGLKARAQKTDLFGAFAEASILFEETPGLQPVLIVLSDMRQDGRGYNFETQQRIDLQLLQRVEKDGLIPSLKGVKVWILGAHTQKVSEIYWMSLKAFWAEYLKRAGAELITFSPNRRWNHE